MIYNITINEDKTIVCDKEIIVNQFENEIDELVFELPFDNFGYVGVFKTPMNTKLELPITDNKIVIGSVISTLPGTWSLIVVGKKDEVVFVSNSLAIKSCRNHLSLQTTQEIDQNVEILYSEIEETLKKLDDTGIDNISSVVTELEEIKNLISTLEVDVDLTEVNRKLDNIQKTINSTQTAVNGSYNALSSSLGSHSNQIKSILNDDVLAQLSEISTKIDNIGGGGTEDWEITDCSYLFAGGARLDILDEILSHISMLVTDMSYMFDAASKLEELDLSSLKLTLVSDMTYMFRKCSKLRKLDINIDTSKVTTFWSMFENCTNLEELNFKINLDGITNSTGLRNTFNKCTSLKRIDFTGTTYTWVPFDVSTTGLERDGIMYMLSTLPVTENPVVITIGTEKMALLTENDLADFASKGYTLA